ncbi:uncharacterized protein BDR25DRAFT_363104 [Lindgomyces ingoldianus]|uniref:Uncharacterized protein n=1 Tax=Lindgomyces ingoldianus TaxID=673940 RepID=A0ACB6Q8G3_9PLEO|nr:uncharacterized protein BDR25DRAFT_363104 [Lindgomyces ingoldianus]KAF2463204.1 hypothetical protein BDR25DRAFT_363104 [Lindgomyces ingoldianus]
MIISRCETKENGLVVNRLKLPFGKTSLEISSLPAMQVQEEHIVLENNIYQNCRPGFMVVAPRFPAQVDEHDRRSIVVSGDFPISAPSGIKQLVVGGNYSGIVLLSVPTLSFRHSGAKLSTSQDAKEGWADCSMKISKLNGTRGSYARYASAMEETMMRKYCVRLHQVVEVRNLPSKMETEHESAESHQSDHT